eukprot:1159678-Pelagomonas_calceolata.AAC.3
MDTYTTSVGGIASDAENLAWPVLPNTGQAAPAIHCLLLPLGNQQQTIHQRLPDPHTQVRGAGHANLIASANFRAFTSPFK